MMKMVMIMTVYDNDEIWIPSSGVCVCVNSSRQCGDLLTSVCVCVCETEAVCVLFHISVWVRPSLIDECVLNKVTTAVEMFLVMVKHLLRQKDWFDQYQRPHERPMDKSSS